MQGHELPTKWFIIQSENKPCNYKYIDKSIEIKCLMIVFTQLFLYYKKIYMFIYILVDVYIKPAKFSVQNTFF